MKPVDHQCVMYNVPGSTFLDIYDINKRHHAILKRKH